ncbi:MAG: hypothetical protein WKF92_16730, partial [Pyrinomonadaceae bacterium]
GPKTDFHPTIGREGETATLFVSLSFFSHVALREAPVVPPASPRLVRDKKGNEFTVVEDRGEKLLVVDAKGVETLRNADRLETVEATPETAPQIAPDAVAEIAPEVAVVPEAAPVEAEAVPEVEKPKISPVTGRAIGFSDLYEELDEQNETALPPQPSSLDAKPLAQPEQVSVQNESQVPVGSFAASYAAAKTSKNERNKFYDEEKPTYIGNANATAQRSGTESSASLRQVGNGDFMVSKDGEVVPHVNVESLDNTSFKYGGYQDLFNFEGTVQDKNGKTQLPRPDAPFTLVKPAKVKIDTSGKAEVVEKGTLNLQPLKSVSIQTDRASIVNNEQPNRQQTETGRLQDDGGLRGSPRVLDEPSGADTRTDSTRAERGAGADARRVYGVPANTQNVPGYDGRPSVVLTDKQTTRPLTTVHLVHYAPAERSHLDSSKWGSNASKRGGAEKAWVNSSKDERLKHRIYAYFDQGAGVTPKSDVGMVAHPITLNFPLYNNLVLIDVSNY